MIGPVFPRRVIRATAVAGLLSTLGCAAALTPSSTAPLAEPLTEEEVGAIATLLRLEDRREFSTAVVPAAAGAPEAVIRARAALTAARTGGPDALDLVRAALGDPDSTVSAVAAFAAGQLRDTLSVPSLAAILDPAFAGLNPTVAVEAAAALGRIPLSTARGVLNAFLTEVDPHDQRLHPVVAEALIATWRTGEAGLRPYIDWIAHPNPDIRWAAAYGLSRPVRPETVPSLFSLVLDSDPLTRTFATRGLAAQAVSAAGESQSSVVGLLIAAAEDPAYPVRIEGIRALSGYDSPAAVEVLERFLRSDSPHELVVAIEGAARSPRGAVYLPRLQQIAGGPSYPSYVREAALEGLFLLDAPAALRLADALVADSDWRVKAALSRSVGRLRGNGIGTLETLARDTDPRVSAAAVEAAVAALRPMNVARIRPLLLEKVNAADPYVRAAALQGLGWLPDPALFPILLDAYDRSQRDAVNVASVAAVDALAELRLAGSVAPERAFFARFVRPRDEEVRARAIARFGAAAPPAWASPQDETPTAGEEYLEYVRRWIAAPPHLRELPRVRIHTELGVIVAELFADDAPLTAANFLRLAEDGFFDEQVWARVIPNFVIQGGDPRGDTSGGPGYTIRDELNRHRFATGTLGMALSGPDTGGSQFFITHSPQPHLDGGYTAFGRVVEGQDLVERMLPGDRILSIREMIEGE